MSYRILLIFALLFFSTYAQAQADIEVSRIKNNIYLLVSPQGGNVVASTGKDGTFIIDDQLSERSKIINDVITKIGNPPVGFILNTHYHFDHTGGNEFYGGKGAIIVAHDNVRKRLSTNQFITYFKREMVPLAKSGLPVVTFEHDVTLHYNDDSIKIVYLPSAHTDGDSAAFFTDENIIVTGDVVFSGQYPFIDIEHGGSVKGIIAASDILLNLADTDTIIVPGHGPLMRKHDLQTYRDVMATVAARIESAINSGKTLAQIIESRPSQEFDDILGNGLIKPDAFATILYEDLSH